MLKEKELLKIGDVKIIKRKISIYNILNGTNYTMPNLGIFEYLNNLNYYGIPFNEINFSKLKEYKRNYSMIKRWFLWILNNCEKKEDQKKYTNKVFFFYKNEFILEQDLKNKIFWLSYKKIWSKIQSKSDYRDLIIRYLLNGILEEHYNCNEFTTEDMLFKARRKLEECFKCKVFTT